MAVSATPLSSALVVRYQTGTTPAGAPVFRQKSLNDVKADAEAVMDTIIHIFLTSSGALTGKRDIRVIDTTTNDLYDPPQV